MEAAVRVYDLSGRLVAEPVSARLAAGKHTRIWNAGNRPSGVYLVHLETDGFSQTQKAVLIR
jgi:hypothetical protein